MSDVAPERDSGGPWLAETDAEADPACEQRELTIATSEHGVRLDKALALLVPEFSRSYLQQLLQEGAVRLNGRIGVKPAHKVCVGDTLLVQMRATEQSQAFRPEPMAIDVVYEDEHLLVVNKPVGLVVHPAAGHWSGTLLNGLLARDAAAAGLPRAGIVHRLDKDTSGLMVVARSRLAMDVLSRAIAAHEVSRRYLALAWGRWPEGMQRCIDAPIGRDARNRLRMAVVDPALRPGKAARTDVLGLATQGRFSLVQCSLHTGRTHQIRVHMASIGHPLLADALYGGAPAADMHRQALHAFSLALTHPVTAAPMRWRAPVPADMRGAMQALGLNYNEP